MDTIADMLVKIKNAGAAEKQTTSFPFSKFKYSLASVLLKEGFVEDVKKRGNKTKKIMVRLKYQDGKHRINGVKRISKISNRVYLGKDKVYIPRQGFGILIVSTPKGLLTSKEARRQKTGGEAICEIW